MCAVSRPLFASSVSRRSIRIWLGQTDQWQPSVITLIPLCFNKTQPNFQQSRWWVEQGIEKKELSLSFIFSSATMERYNNDQYLATLCVVTVSGGCHVAPDWWQALLSDREREWHSLLGRGMRCLASEDQSVIVVTFLWCHLRVGQCHYRALSWTLWPVLNAQHQATKGLDSYLLSQFKSWMLFGTTTIPSLSPSAHCTVLRVDTDCKARYWSARVKLRVNSDSDRL